MSIVQQPPATEWHKPLPATPGIITTEFINSEPFDKEAWTERWRKLMAERETSQTAEEYASLYFEPDSLKWLIAYAAFEAGRKA